MQKFPRFISTDTGALTKSYLDILGQINAFVNIKIYFFQYTRAFGLVCFRSFQKQHLIFFQCFADCPEGVASVAAGVLILRGELGGGDV